MIRLLTNLFRPKDDQRWHELVGCLLLNSSRFDELVVVLSDTDLPNIGRPVHTFQHSGRIQFNVYFDIIEKLDTEAINVIANADIYFDQTISLINTIGQKDFYILNRHDDNALLNSPDAQDAWVFKSCSGQKAPKNLDQVQGTPGCDNSLAYAMHMNGYNVSNPSRSIICHHVHKNHTRSTYCEHSKPPYLFIWPHKIGECPIHDIRSTT